MKSICLNCKPACIIACLAASCLFSQTVPGINILEGIDIKKAAFADDGSLYILAKRETAVRVYAADGSPRRSLPIDPTQSLKLQGGELEDLIVDANGIVYCLTFRPELPYHQSGIVRIDKAAGASTVISLSKPLHGFQIDKDEAGNLYVLGLEPDVNRSIAQKQDWPSTVNIIHKFSPDGEYLRSLLPMAGSSVDEKLVNAMRLPSSFVVLPHGEVWFLELRVDPQTPPWESARAVYQVDKNGSAERVDPVSPPNHYLMGIHEHAGDVVLQWADRKSSLLRVLTRMDGTRIGSVEGGNIRAIRRDRAICSRIGEGGSFQLVMSQIN